MIYYIADLHFGHANVIKFDNRPFSDVNEMDKYMIELWNLRVKDEDHVYIVGDVSLNNKLPIEKYLAQLKGHKHLIRGNHDGRLLDNQKAMEYFDSVDDILEINDEGRRVCMCHYPMAEWPGYYRGSWHIYGHIHNNKNEAFYIMKDKERALNAAVAINNYMPVTFNELVVNNANFIAVAEAEALNEENKE